MELQYFKDYHELSLAAHSWVLEKLERYEAKSIYVPAGGTPKGLYQEWEQSNHSWAKGLQFLQIDDVIRGSQTNIFRTFFKEHLPSFQEQMVFIEANHPKQADLGILGLGLNGHVAFHEPHMQPDFTFGEVQLNETTKKTLNLEGDATGLSYGTGAFLKTKAVLLMISGNGKEETYKRFLEKDMSLPVSHLHEHSELTVMALEELKP